MTRKIFSVLLAGLVVAGLVLPAFADDYVATLADYEDADLPAAAAVGGAAELPCKSAILIELSTGRVLFEKEPDTPMPPASITKVMTLLLVMEAIEKDSIRYDDIVTCSEEAASMGGSQIWFEPGEQMTVEELIRAVAVVSANDASVALGEFIAGSHEGFVTLMNERARELGMTRTVFKNATGLDDPDHVTTARDIAAMSAELLRHSDITKFTTIWMDELRGGDTLLVNTNKLVRYYDGATGLKTGTTSNAGHCLSASALRNDMHLVAVVLGSETGDLRFSAARGLLDYGFANYELVATPDMPGGAAPVKVSGGVLPEVPIVADAPATLLVPKGRGKDIAQQVQLTEGLTAPVAEGQTVGRVVLALDDSEIATYPLLAGCELKEMTFFSAMGILFKEACALS